MGAYLSYVVQHSVMTAIVYAVGRALRQGIGAESEARRIHGRYVFWWAVGAFALGGLLGPLLGGADTTTGAGVFAMFCMLCGWLVGSVHGAVVLAARHFRPERTSMSRRYPDAEQAAAPDGRKPR